MLLNKYKYSLNRGLSIKTEPKKKLANIKTYAIVSQNTPVLYDISVSPQKDTLILYNDQQYMHRKCTLVTDSSNEVVDQVEAHYQYDKNNLTVFIANEASKSEQIIMGVNKHRKSLICQCYRGMMAKKKPKSSIVISIVGVCSENMLTDQFYQQLNNDQYDNFEQIRPILRLRNTDHSVGKYELQSITKKHIRSQAELEYILGEYKQIKNQKQYLSISSQKYWDWLQGQLFMIEQIEQRQDSDDAVVHKSHYILKINQYLQTTSSLMLKLGITLRKLQQTNRKAAQTNETKLFKLISNCWTNSSLHSIHLFLQIGHHLTLKQQYLSLVSTSEIINPIQDSADFSSLSFCYIKGYENYPKITTFLSKLNKQNTQNKQVVHKGHPKSVSLDNGQYDPVRIKVRPYARDTFSSIQKKRVNSIQMEFEQTQQQHNKNLDHIIQEAANLYKQSDQDNFRLSYIKKQNDAALKRHKKIVEKFSTLDNKLPPQFYRSERMRQKSINKQFINTKTPKETIKSQQKQSANFRLSSHGSAFEIYAKGKRIRNYRQYYSKKQKRQESDFAESMVKKEILQLQREDDIFLFDEGQKEIY